MKFTASIAGFERFEFGLQEKDAILVRKREFFYIPPRTTHRDVNPTPDERQEAVLFLRGSGPVVISMVGPDGV